jgi:hypothetical protein
MELKNFAILQGENATIEDGRIIIPVPKPRQKGKDSEDSDVKRVYYEIRSDVKFVNGTVEFKFKSSSHSTGLLLLIGTPEGEGAAIGLSKGVDSFIIAKGTKLITPIVKNGSFKNYSLNEEHLMKIVINGSEIKLFVDGIIMCEHSMGIAESPLQWRMSSDGSLEIYDFKVHRIKPKIFIVMQFSKEYNELYEDVLRPVAENYGFECVRADEFYTSTPILKDIIESIVQSSAVIAEITPDNPNVFYEIGYSHAIGKPTILLCDRKREKLPFDLSSFRTLFYENTIAGKKKVEDSLKKYLQSII